MKLRKIFFPTPPFIIIWSGVIFLLITSLLLIISGLISPVWFIIPLIVLGIALYDSLQTKHSITRNYPLLGHLRFWFESVRPELRQYFFEGELDGKPFNRRQRSIVYQRAKNEKQTVSFGMQDDPGRIGYEWAAHSVYPQTADYRAFRTRIGGSSCRQPYDASVFNIGAMSYGALSKTAVSSLNKGALMGGFAQNTGEGGISEFHMLGADLIWQIGTGYFGCRNSEGRFDEALFAEKAALPNVKMIEIKLSQGAKPGHGGLLPAHKNTPEIAAIRNIEPHTTVHSPAGHTAFTDAESLLYFIDKLRQLSGAKPIGFKICIGREDEFTEILECMKTTGITPDFITVDGAEGGTGAAPLEFIDYMGMGLTESLVFVHASLQQFGLRREVKLLASGKLITAFDIAKHLALGADACYSARGMMFALGCIQALQCDSGKCPVGIATQNKTLYSGIDPTEKSVRVANFHLNTMKALADFIGACGCRNLQELKSSLFFRKTDINASTSLERIYHLRNSKTLSSKHQSILS